MDAGALETVFKQAVALQRADRLGEAESLYKTFLGFAPTFSKARMNLCLALLAQGKFEEGWPLYEERFVRADRPVPRPTIPFPEWTGEPLNGRSILVWPEQGFGDQILMARFARVLEQQMGARVTFACPAPLTRLFGSLGVDVAQVGQPMKLHDYWIMAGSLPWRVGLTRDTIPGAAYLAATPGAAPGGVGYAWTGDPRNPNHAVRALPPEALAVIQALPSALSLHPEDTGAKDFAETADIIAGLDVVITVDTAIAHLAGALGKPCWVLLPASGVDWRWPRQETVSAWYPTARLFRQAEAGDWMGVMERVRAAFADRARA